VEEEKEMTNKYQGVWVKSRVFSGKQIRRARNLKELKIELICLFFVIIGFIGVGFAVGWF